MAAFRPLSCCTMRGVLFMWPAVRFAPPRAVCGRALADRYSISSSPRALPPQLLARTSLSLACLPPHSFSPGHHLARSYPVSGAPGRSLCCSCPVDMGKTCFLARSSFPRLPASEYPPLPCALCQPFVLAFFFFFLNKPRLGVLF